MNQSSKVYNNFVGKLNEKMMEIKRKKFSHLIFLCIGTDRVTGDSFGPLVGHKLNERFGQKYKNILVIGDLKEPLCSTNYLEKLKLVHQITSNPYIIAIDSAFSRQEDIGKIVLKEDGIQLGRGINKAGEKIGNISIQGIVAKDHKIPKLNFTVLQNVPLGLVMNLAQQTANGIYRTIEQH